MTSSHSLAWDPDPKPRFERLQFLPRALFLFVFGAVMIVLVYCIFASATVSDVGMNKGQPITQGDIIRAVATEVVRSSLAPIWKSVPWPDGVVIARVQGRLPKIPPIGAHAALNAVVFSILGFAAGRVLGSFGALFLPPLLFFMTLGLLRSGIYTVAPLTPVTVVLILAVQFVCVYGIALWSKWSQRH